MERAYVNLKSKQRLIEYTEALSNQLNSVTGSEVYCDLFGSSTIVSVIYFTFPF